MSFALDRYGRLFPGSEQKLNDALDALAEEAGATTTMTPADDPNTNTEKNPKNPNSIAHVARTPGDSAPTAQGV